MSHNDRDEEIQAGHPDDGGRRRVGVIAPLGPHLFRRPGRRMPAERIGLLVGGVFGAAVGVALSTYWSPISLSYHEGPAAMAGIEIDDLPAAILCGVIGASLLANVGWAVGILIALLRKARAAANRPHD